MTTMTKSTYDTLLKGVTSLSSACESIDDAYARRQLKLTGNLFIDTLNAAIADVNARAVRDLDFSFRDLETVVVDNGYASDERFAELLDHIRLGLASLRDTASLPLSTVERILALKAKLAERRRAAERATFRPPDAPVEPLPHPPRTLQAEAESLRHELGAAGFETPVLDTLATQPDDFLIRDCSYLIDELEPILG